MPYHLKCKSKDECKAAEGFTGKHPGKTFSNQYLTRDRAIRQLAAIKINEKKE